MFNNSRIDIYEYLHGLFYDTVTKNVYSMSEPQELTESDTKDGFIVIRIGNINDTSEFDRCVYGWVRCYVEAFIPPKSRGRLDFNKYAEFENAINSVIESAARETSGQYQIQQGSVISNDGEEVSNANNVYFTFIKSFIVDIL